MFLGTHAIIQPVSEKIFDKSGLTGTQFFLEHFVDDSGSPDRKFSKIANEIHAMRNVHAHQWSAGQLHNLVFNYKMTKGWEVEGQALHIKPEIYVNQFQGLRWTQRSDLGVRTLDDAIGTAPAGMPILARLARASKRRLNSGRN